MEYPTPVPYDFGRMQLRRHRPTCIKCGRHRDDVGPMSNSGQCHECGMRALSENIYGLVYKQGEPLRRWREGMARSVGAQLPDA